MPCFHYQGPSLGLGNKPKLRPTHQDHKPRHAPDHGQQSWDPLAIPILLMTPLPDPECESDGSLVSTYLLVSSWLSRSAGSRCSHHVWCHQEPGGHMKINLPAFKDEELKDAIIYQSWNWDIMLHCQAWSQDFTHLHYIIHSLQGYPGELVRSSGTNINLDGMLLYWTKIIIMWRVRTLWTKNFSNSEWARKRMCQSGVCHFWKTSRFSALRPENAFPQTTLPNWSMITSMEGCLSG